MIYFIENDYLFVKVSSRGAELTSIKNKDNGVEYLWQGDEKYWAGQAPVMFPICGRLYEGKYTYLPLLWRLNPGPISARNTPCLITVLQEQVSLRF